VIHALRPASLGIAGVNTRPLHAATLGIAGNWGSALRPHLERITSSSPMTTGSRLGDRASRACWAHACYLLDYTYLTCPDRDTGLLRYRSGFARLCAPETRHLPLYLDSAAYREAVGTAPAWSSNQRYCEAIDLIRPDGAMARDVLDDQEASRVGYEHLCGDGYGQLVIPVWQARPAWNPTCDVSANGRLAASDPILRAYANRAPVVAIGGRVQGPCPWAARHLYLAELVRALPDTHFWALGQLVGDVNMWSHDESWLLRLSLTNVYFDLGHRHCTHSFFEQCPHRIARARCDFYVPKDSTTAQLLQARHARHAAVEDPAQSNQSVSRASPR
jgi:hypothetical protein